MAFRSKDQTSSELPLYSPIDADQLDHSSVPLTMSSASSSDLNFSDTEPDHLSLAVSLKPAQRHASSSSSPSSTWLSPPPLSRFLADFTLGFADGLTVPFALTAGLSSLGQTDTVIYAGMAEICAGSISMGIGGYLSAKGEALEANKPNTTITTVDKNADTVAEEKLGSTARVEDYLVPLDLPPELLDLIHQHIILRSDITTTLAQKVATEEEADDDNADSIPPSPIIVGASVAMGYLIGGILPLFPYFIVSRVREGLVWSFIVCIVALFLFGFTKDFILHKDHSKERTLVEKKGPGNGWRECRTISWMDIRRSGREGLLMVVLGSIAALAAALCVRLFEGMAHGQPQSEYGVVNQ